jgi:hypothetical protein
MPLSSFSHTRVLEISWVMVALASDRAGGCCPASQDETTSEGSSAMSVEDLQPSVYRKTDATAAAKVVR